MIGNADKGLCAVIGNANPLGGGGGSVTDALNGTHLNGTIVYLGGQLLEPTTISGNDSTPFDVVINPGGTGGELNLGFDIATIGFNAIAVKQITMQDDGGGILVTESKDALGLMGFADYTDETKDLQYMQRAGAASTIVASVNKEGQNAAVTALTFTPVFPGTFRVNLTAGYVSGAGNVLGFNLVWTDIRGNANNHALPGTNVTSGNTTTFLGAIVINSQAGTPVSIVTGISGSVVYDYTIVIEKLKLPPIT